MLCIFWILTPCFFVKCLFKSFDHCLLGYWIFCVGLEFFICTGYELLSDVCTMNIFSQIVALLLYFIFLMMHFDDQKLLVLVKFKLAIFSLCLAP